MAVSEDELQLSQLSCMGQSSDVTATRVEAVQGAVTRLNDMARSLRDIAADIDWRGDAHDAALAAFSDLAAELNEHADAINAIAEADNATAAPMHQAYLDYNTLQGIVEGQYKGPITIPLSVAGYRAEQARIYRQNLDSAMNTAQSRIVTGATWDLGPGSNPADTPPPSTPSTPPPSTPASGGQSGSGGSGGSGSGNSGGGGGSAGPTGGSGPGSSGAPPAHVTPWQPDTGHGAHATPATHHDANAAHSNGHGSHGGVAHLTHPGTGQHGQWHDAGGQHVQWQDTHGQWHQATSQQLQWSDANGHWHDADGQWQDAHGHWHDAGAGTTSAHVLDGRPALHHDAGTAPPQHDAAAEQQLRWKDEHGAWHVVDAGQLQWQDAQGAWHDGDGQGPGGAWQAAPDTGPQAGPVAEARPGYSAVADAAPRDVMAELTRRLGGPAQGLVSADS